MYFITICAQDRKCLFGKITVGASLVNAPNVNTQIADPENVNVANNNNTPTMQLNDSGKMIEKEWLALPNRFNNIQLHEFIIMPNHFHGILEIRDTQNDNAQNIVARRGY